MGYRMNKFLLVMCLCLPALGQATYPGGGTDSGSATYSTDAGSGQGILVGENAYCTPGAGTEITEGTPTWGTSDGPATLLSQCMNTAMASTPSGTHIGGGAATTFLPATGATLTNVLASTTTSLVNLDGTAGGSFYLQCGDTIQLAAGSSYQGSFTFPDLACDGGHWIMVKSSGVSNGNFPGEGVRATPCLAGISNDAANGYSAPGYPPYSCLGYPAVLTAQLLTTSGPAIQFASGANHYRFVGIEFTKQADIYVGQLIVHSADAVTMGANHIIFDRSLIHGQPWTLSSGQHSETQAGIKANNSQWIASINSWNYDTYCVNACTDSQGFSAGAGVYQDGPFKIYNNMIATSGESWLFGGGGQGPGTPNSTGIEIRANVSMKNLGWMVPIEECWVYPNHVDSKNLGEFKNGSYVLMEGNYFENSWEGCQSDEAGHALLLDPRNQSSFNNANVTFDGTDMVVTTSGSGQNIFIQSYSSGRTGYPDDAANCPVGGCRMMINDSSRTDNGARYYFCNGTNGCDQTGMSLHSDGKQARLVTPASGPAPAGTASTAKTCVPGLAPSAATNHVVVRYNEFSNLTNGISMVTAISDCGDEAQSLDHISAHDNYLHGLSVEMANDSSPYLYAAGFEMGNGQIYSVLHAITVAHNTNAVETGNPAIFGSFGQQVDHQDNRYLQGLHLNDNVSLSSWHINHSSGAMTNGGLGTTFQTDACHPYYPNDASNDTDGAGNVLNPVASGMAFTFSPALAHYIVTKNGTIPATSNVTTTGFTLNVSLAAGDALTVRDVTDCDWVFVGNILGEALPGSGAPEDPYPNGTDPYSGLATPNANNANSCGTGGTQACILSGSGFTSIFNSWDPRNGNLGIASSTYKGTATDAGSRAATGKDPGADLTTIGNLLAGVHAAEVYPALAITSGTLTAATHGVAYQNTLAATTGASPYKSWWQETDTSHCGGDCGTTPAALVAAGIVIGRSGTVNGPFIVLTGSRSSNVSTFNPKQQMVSEMLGTPVVPWQAGQVITLSGFVNGTGTQANDASFNGTCTISTVTTNTFSCPQTGVDIASHTIKGAGGGTPTGMVSFAPVTPGTYQFWMGAKDGAFQETWAQISVTVN
jgi:hypothetical protein